MSSEPDNHIRADRDLHDDDRAKRARELRRRAGEHKDKAVEAGKVATDVIGGALESAVEMLGGWTELDGIVRAYNRQLYEFATNGLFAKTNVLNGPTKLLMCCAGCSLVQSFFPVFAWPLDAASQLLSFLFLYNTALSDLRDGFKRDSEIHRIKSLLTTFLITFTTQLIPGFLFDSTYHFGALWTFFLPVLLFINPDGKDKAKTIASLVSDTVFVQVEQVIRSVIPREFEGKDGNRWSLVTAAVMALFLWMGFVGATGSYVATWALLSLQTVSALGASVPRPSDDPKGYVEAMTTQHCLLAIWMWRYLLSTIESFTIPPFFSMIGFIMVYLPSYYLWVTAFFIGMLVTPKLQKSYRADTWYAKWLRGPQEERSRSSRKPEGESKPSRPA